jgi:hypothetical protein
MQSDLDEPRNDLQVRQSGRMLCAQSVATFASASCPTATATLLTIANTLALERDLIQFRKKGPKGQNDIPCRAG